MMQSYRLPCLWIALISLATLAATETTETPEEDTLPMGDLPVIDPAPIPTDEDRPSRPAFGGWSSFLGAIPRRRSSHGDKAAGGPRSGRRNSQQTHGGGRRRGEKNIILPQLLIPTEFSGSNDVEKTRGRGSEPRNRKQDETDDFSKSSVVTQPRDGGEDGGRFGRGHGGRRGCKKKDDAQPQQTKSEGRRSGLRSDKNKAQSSAETETNTDSLEGEGATSFAVPASFGDPCEDLLATRAGSAKETVEALLTNIDDPDALRPILEDLDLNVNGPPEE
ncbi:hypothetical protein ElyMa_006893500 [Elysia marginata]|uniref:Uncharacterized protein n=1 Tax=Elysia marginata TaxID=1093978 RepID=A0AAV4JBN6_9GAST|nr:hypothetical protein ElyMa_006893500 [Elysia marginata]